MNCYVDIETTGFSAKQGTFTRISAVLAHRYEVVDFFDQMINPNCRVQQRLLEMTGLEQPILDLMPNLSVVREKFIQFSKGHRLIGWGDFENRWLPFHGLAAKVFDGIQEVKKVTRGQLHLKNYKLVTLCQHFKIPLNHHNSLSDALAVYHICNLTGAFQ